MNPNATTHHLIDTFKAMIQQDQLAHAHLFYSARSHSTVAELQELSRMILCHNQHQAPCGQCQSCQLFMNGVHPDCMIIEPEKRGGTIKIDTIRACQETVYISPQMGHGRVVLIYSIERMNAASCNAFLKLLEEPPSQVYFLLHTTQLGGLLPTLVSRCQIWKSTDNDVLNNGLPVFLNALSGEEDVARLIEFLPRLCEDILQLTTLAQHWSFVAAKWVEFGILDVSAILYWITTVCIKIKCGVQVNYRSDLPLTRIAQNVTISKLFNQLEHLTGLLRSSQQGIAVNPTLAIEQYLLA